MHSPVRDVPATITDLVVELATTPLPELMSGDLAGSACGEVADVLGVAGTAQPLPVGRALVAPPGPVAPQGADQPVAQRLGQPVVAVHEHHLEHRRRLQRHHRDTGCGRRGPHQRGDGGRGHPLQRLALAAGTVHHRRGDDAEAAQQPALPRAEPGVARPQHPGQRPELLGDDGRLAGPGVPVRQRQPHRLGPDDDAPGAAGRDRPGPAVGVGPHVQRRGQRPLGDGGHGAPGPHGRGLHLHARECGVHGAP